MPQKIVLDSSVVVKWLNQENELHFSQAQQLLKDLEAGKIAIHLPELVKYEVGNALLSKGLSLPQTKASLTPLCMLPIIWETETQALAHTTLTLATEAKITYYDACFLSLAKHLKAKLITANPKHQNLPAIKVIPLAHYR